MDCASCEPRHYLTSLAALFAASPDVMFETMYDVASDAHGLLSVIRMFGTFAEGLEFESVVARLALYRDGRHVATELFEVEDLARARARFEQVRADLDATRTASQEEG